MVGDKEWGLIERVEGRRRRERWRPPFFDSITSRGVGELDVEGAEVGLQASILDGEEIGGFARLVKVGVPEAGWGDEGGEGFPVHAFGVFDLA